MAACPNGDTPATQIRRRRSVRVDRAVTAHDERLVTVAIGSVATPLAIAFVADCLSGAVRARHSVVAKAVVG
jgi:hypothetical protein